MMKKIKVIALVLIFLSTQITKGISQQNSAISLDYIGFERQSECFKGTYIISSPTLLHANNIQEGYCSIVFKIKTDISAEYTTLELNGIGETCEYGGNVVGFNIIVDDGGIRSTKECSDLQEIDENGNAIHVNIYNYSSDILDYYSNVEVRLGEYFDEFIRENDGSPSLYAHPYQIHCCPSLNPKIVMLDDLCADEVQRFRVETDYPELPLNYKWYLDGEIFEESNFSYRDKYFIEPGINHELRVEVDLGIQRCITNSTEAVLNFATRNCPCEDCQSSFAPEQGKKYILSAWARQDGLKGGNNYEAPQIQLEFNGIVHFTFSPSGKIVDGWQRIYGEFTVPVDAVEFAVELGNTETGAYGSNQIVYFDDIRIHPFNAMMKSYVYNPETLEFMSELDENGFATFYEYDEEGTLVRVKQETEKGVMTIKETRNNISKKK